MNTVKAMKTWGRTFRQAKNVLLKSGYHVRTNGNGHEYLLTHSDTPWAEEIMCQPDMFKMAEWLEPVAKEQAA